MGVGLPSHTENLRRNLNLYLELSKRLKKRGKLILLICLAGICLSAVIAYLIPPIYRSSTLILVQQQRVPTSYVQSPISVDLGERLRTLTTQIMSRARLERIIGKFELYGPTKNPKDLERKVERMRQAINVQVKGEDTFRIYFGHRSPETAKRATEELAHLFIEENLRDRAQQAMSTSEFLDGELDDFKKQLEAQEAALREYKESHLGVLPEQQTANLRALDRFQSQYQANAEALQGARDRKAGIEGQLSKESEGNAVMVPSEPQLELMRAELADKRAQLTDKHPDVRMLTRKIGEMERKLAELRKSGSQSESANDPYMRSVLDKLERVNREIAQLESEQQALTDNIAKFQRRIESLPSVEEKLTLLTRDYETTRANYQALLNKKFEARLSMNLEKKQKDDAFKVLDPPYLPASPASPRRDLIILVGTLVSMALGLGVAFTLESLDTTIRSAADLGSLSGAPVLAVIPHLRKANTDETEVQEEQATA